MEKKAIIFDLDGVIISTDELHFLAWKKIADDEKIPFDKDDNDALRGVSRMDSLELILRKSKKVYSEEEKLILANKKNDIYRRFLSKLTKNDLSRDTLNTLNKLKENGYLMAIGSSSKNTKYILYRIGLLDFFNAIVDGDDISHSKPNPEVFLKAAEKLKVNPEYTYVLEDAVSGIEAAKNGGFIPIAIGPASFSKDAKFIIKKFSDLNNILK